jgi:hypothetical protein
MTQYHRTLEEFLDEVTLVLKSQPLGETAEVVEQNRPFASGDEQE